MTDAEVTKPGLPAAPPNVLLYVVDTLRRDHVGAYGYERDTTPVIDALAAEGLLFEDAIAKSAALTRTST